MKMRDSIMQIYNLLRADEELMRLLYYTTDIIYDFSNVNDPEHPLNPTKPDITALPTEDRWNITRDVIKTTKTQDGLDGKTKNRLCIYNGSRPNNTTIVKGAYKTAEQSIIVDVFTPIKIDEIDIRMAWIIDRMNEVLFGKTLLNVGISDLLYKNGNRVDAPEGYNGYAMIYRFQDFN